MPRHHIKSQVTLEYLTLAVFVLAAIFLMGPYLIRSINSYFMFTEEGMMDSMGEQFNQSSQLPNVAEEGCACGSWTARGCAEGGCQKNERLSTRTCNPAGCDISRKCDPAANCCENVEGLCGGTVTQWDSTVVTCAGTEILYYRDCGGAGIYNAYCVEDPIFCSSTCLGSKDTNSNWCPDSLTGPIPPATVISYVDQTSGCPASGAKCVAICNTGYTAVPTGCVLVPPTTTPPTTTPPTTAPPTMCPAKTRPCETTPAAAIGTTVTTCPSGCPVGAINMTCSTAGTWIGTDTCSNPNCTYNTSSTYWRYDVGSTLWSVLIHWNSTFITYPQGFLTDADFPGNNPPYPCYNISGWQYCVGGLMVDTMVGSVHHRVYGVCRY